MSRLIPKTLRPFASLRRMAALGAGVALAACAACSRRSEPGAGVPARPASLHDFPAALASSITDAEAKLRQNSRDEKAWLQLAQLYHANDFFDEARTCYEHVASERNEQGARGCYGLAMLAQSTGDLAAEVRWLRETLARDASYTTAQLRLALASSKSGDTATALASFRTVLEKDPTNAEAQVGLARARLSTGDLDGARKILETVAAQHPGFSTGFSLLAQVVEKQGDAARAASLREQARMRKDPSIADPWMDGVMELCFSTRQLAMRFEDFVKSGMEDQALATLRRLESIDPKHPLVLQMRGAAAAQQGNGAEALREYEAALASGPRTPDLLVVVANTRLRLGDADGATRALEEALAQNPEHVGANVSLARIHWEAGRHAAAAPYLEKVRRASPSDVPSRAMLGEYFLEQLRPADALVVLNEAHALAADNAPVGEMLALAHVRVGNDLARQGRFDDALAAYDRAIDVRPATVEAHANKVQVLLHLRRQDEAGKALQSWIASQPDEPAAWLLLGDVQHASGQAEQSVASWSHARQLLAANPNAELQQAIGERLGRSGAAP